ncbi:Auxin induced-like protein [Zostera marina]|uniref:Cytochrome b561 and DOMON domain-containing protein n=1 Tax=Zostera marina TaxID=29655 RepID=A0A0K9NX81_ZOSMR|nr:Auxin induced-like protein [Zostera marina]
MASCRYLLLVLCVLSSVATLFISSSAQNARCSAISFETRSYNFCTDLPTLDSTLHWTYDNTSNSIDFAYRSDASEGWVAWGINPTGSSIMRGTQAFVAYINSTDNGAINTRTTSIEGYSTSLEQGDLSFAVSGLSGEMVENTITIFANITLPPLSGNRTEYNHIWQVGPIDNGALSVHPLVAANTQAAGSIDFQSGASTGVGNSVIRRRNTHGVINALSWGVLMPIGVIMARYLRVFKAADPAWFYLHMTIQTSAYIIGVAGFSTGIQLGNDSEGIEQTEHRILGIALFCCATLQVFALLLRPSKDHKYRRFWNFYHHSIGYSVIVLSIINIFEGFEILSPENKWKNAYIGIISSLGGIALILEITTWIIVLNRKKAHGANP